MANTTAIIEKGFAMKHIDILAVIAAFLSVSAFADTIALGAEDTAPIVALKPMSGPGASSGGHRFLLNKIGR